MKLNETDKQKTLERYNERYRQFGVSPKTLGWLKGKQEIRFDILTSQWDFSGTTVLDIGCGFADLYAFLVKCTKFQHIRYIGVDINENLINEAKNLYKDDPNVFLFTGDFLEIASQLNKQFAIDYTLISGTFNFVLEAQKNEDFVFAVLKQAFNLSSKGVASDFLSDNVDFKNPQNYHMDIPTLYGFTKTLTRNMLLRHDYMPFEYAIFLNKDDSFSEKTVFNAYEKH